MSELRRDGVTIFYEQHGPGRGGIPLLLSHGFGASSGMWWKNIDALAADRPVITWDLRGHGRSSSPDDPALYTQDASLEDMTAVLDACGAGRVVLGGHSLGGFLSIAYTAAHPDRVAALMLFNTGPGFKKDDAREEWNAMARGIADAIEQQGVEALGAGPELSGGDHDPKGLAAAARGILVQRDAAVIHALPDIAVPTLVLVGSRDRRYLAAADYQAAKIPGAVKAVVPDAGHAANLDQPDAFNAIVTQFLQEVPHA